MTRRVIIDTDPGIDDTMALLLALRSPELELVGISVVAGNIEVDLAALNALKILHLEQRRVPVAVGAAAPLLRTLRTAPFIHGKDGLGDLLGPPEPPSFESLPASAFLVEKIMAGQVDEVIALGPLTNLAAALLYEPRLRERLPKITLMGGSVRREGNTTPGAEFNIYTDPEAAAIVFRSRIPITMIGLNVTMQTIFPYSMTRRLQGMGHRASSVVRFIASVTDFYARHYRTYYNIDGCAMHDPLTVGVAIDSSLVRGQQIHVDIETQGRLTTGETVADFWRMPQPWGEPNAFVALDVDSARFLRLFVERVLPELTADE